MYLIITILSFVKDKEYRKLLTGTSVIIAVGTVFYHYIEGWSWIDAAYFSVITLTTIGYGVSLQQPTWGNFSPSGILLLV